MSSPTAPFTLSVASKADLPEIMQSMYISFPKLVQEVMMGCLSEADVPKATAHFEEELRTYHHGVWIKVVDKATGRIAAASLWKIYPNAGAPADEKPMAWLEGELLEKAKNLIGTMNEWRRKANPGGHVHLHILFTRPEYKRQGAGTLMMDWGCNVADSMSLPAWIEASIEGNFLYKVHGFEDVETPTGFTTVTFMRREPGALIREGGHVKI